jgi:hypothetical protein
VWANQGVAGNIFKPTQMMKFKDITMQIEKVMMIREIMKVTLAQKPLQTTWFGEFLAPNVSIA